MTEFAKPTAADGPPPAIAADQLATEATRLISDRAETVLNAVAEGVFLLDQAGRTVFVNAAGARMFGFSAREMLGRSHHELIHHHYADGGDFPLGECPIYASVTEGITQRVGADTFWRKDSSRLPVDYTAIPIREQRRIVGAVVTFRDVTTEQRVLKQQELLEGEREARAEAEAAQAALAASEERLRLAMSAGRLGSWEWNILAGTVLWSPEKRHCTGLPRARSRGPRKRMSSGSTPMTASGRGRSSRRRWPRGRQLTSSCTASSSPGARFGGSSRSDDSSTTRRVSRSGSWG